MDKLLGGLTVLALLVGAPTASFACEQADGNCDEPSTLAADDGAPDRAAEGARDMARAKISIAGLACESCPAQLESTLREIQGVFEVGVSGMDEEASIIFRPEELDVGILVEAIHEAEAGDFEAEVVEVSPMTVGGR